MHAFGFGWTAAQLPLTLLFAANCDEKTVSVYSLSYNTSIVVTTTSASLPAAHIGLAFAVMLFGLLTMQMKQADLMDNMTEYSNAYVQTFTTWNIMMWLTFVLFHVLLVAKLINPVDIYCAGFVSLGQFVTIHYLCKSRDMYKGVENIALLVYFCMCVVLYNEMHTHSGARLALLSSAVIADMLLVTGHVYDDATNVETIGNCRLFYTCSAALINLSMFFFE